MSLRDRTDLCQAVLFGGTSLYLWNEAPELKAVFLGACSLEEGMDVFLVGSFLEECGLWEATQSILRSWGQLRAEDIGGRTVRAFQALGTSQDTPSEVQLDALSWEFSYLDDVPDESLDRVILFNAASHVRDWKRFAAQVGRVLCRGGRVVVAEAPLGGAAFRKALLLHPGWQPLFTELLHSLGLQPWTLPAADPRELQALFAPYLSWTRCHEWRGLYVLYGQKGSTEREEFEASQAAQSAGQLGEEQFSFVPGPDLVSAFPPASVWVRNFVKRRPVRTTWSLMAEVEREVWEDAAVEIVRSGGESSGLAARLLAESLGCEGGGTSYEARVEAQEASRLFEEAARVGLEIRQGARVLIVNVGGGSADVLAPAISYVQERAGLSGGSVAVVGLAEEEAVPSSREVAHSEPMGLLVAGFPENSFDSLLVCVSGGGRLASPNDPSLRWASDLSALLRAVRPDGRVLVCGLDPCTVESVEAVSAFAGLVLRRVLFPAGSPGDDRQGFAGLWEARPAGSGAMLEDLWKGLAGALRDIKASKCGRGFLFWGQKCA